MKKNSTICLLLLLGLIIHWSCRKNYEPAIAEVSDKAVIESAKLFLSSSSNYEKSTNSLVKNANSSVPIWNDAERKELPDGSSLLFVSIADYKLGTTKVDYVRKYIFSEKNGVVSSGNIVEIYGEPNYISKNKDELLANFNKSQILDFTGSIIIYNLQYKYFDSRVFKDGKMVNAKSKIGRKGSVIQNTKRNGSTVIAQNETSCLDWYWVTEYYDGDGNFLYSTWEYLYTVCNGGTGGDGGGGGGGGPFPGNPNIDCAGVENGSAYNSDCGCIGGTTGIPYCPRDPCARKAILNMQAQNQITVTNKATIIANSTTVEWGAEQNVNTYPGSFTYNPVTPRTNGATGTFASNFVWNATDGYTIGISHGHPSGTGPSPADAFWAIGNLTNQDLINSGGTNYYKENISVTTYLPDGTTLLLQIEDWAALQAEYNIYKANPAAYNQSYVAEATKYFNANPTSTDVGMAGTWALLSKLGNAIQIYKAAPNSNVFAPLQKTSFTMTVNPC